MFPLHTILHPTDFSSRADYAFQLACSLARDHGARVLVLHVIPPPELGAYDEIPLMPPLTETYRQELDVRLRAMTETYRQEHDVRLRAMTVPGDKVAIDYRLEEGLVPHGIVRVAEETKADLIVMGTHGRTGLSRLLLGSVAEQVLRKGPCPVLTVKSPMPQAGPEKTPVPAVAAQCT